MTYRKDFFISILNENAIITKNAEGRILKAEDFLDPKLRYLYKPGDKILTPFGIQTINHIDYNYGPLDGPHGYEWLIFVEENGNQYKPIELIGIVAAEMTIDMELSLGVLK